MSSESGKDGETGGVLYVVATPIGNLGDISRRALDVLACVDLILAEDTRRTAKLLSHYGIDTPRLAFHEHNERRLCERVVERIARGANVALVSDAGTPLVSDPGYRLVDRLRELGHRVVPVPGPSALVSALSVAGLPTDRFCFEGFLPPRAEARARRLEALAGEQRTLVFFESPHRIADTLAALAAAFGEGRTAVVARELTKAFETVTRGSLGELAAALAADAQSRRGEFVVVVAPAEAGAGEGDEAAEDALLCALLEELPLKKAVAVAARVTGRRRNEVYRRALALRDAAGRGA